VNARALLVRERLLADGQLQWLWGDTSDVAALLRAFRVCALCDADLSGPGEAMPALYGFEDEPGQWICFDRRGCTMRAAKRVIEAANRAGPGIAYATQMVIGATALGPRAMIEAPQERDG
jgi:hypothetical protein